MILCECPEPQVYLDAAVSLCDEPEEFCDLCDGAIEQSTVDKITEYLEDK